MCGLYRENREFERTLGPFFKTIAMLVRKTSAFPIPRKLLHLIEWNLRLNASERTYVRELVEFLRGILLRAIYERRHCFRST